MKTNFTKLICCVSGLILLAPRAEAGPHPLPVLHRWLVEAKMQLTSIEIQIAQATQELEAAERDVGRLEAALAANPRDSALAANLLNARKRVGDLKGRLVVLHEQMAEVEAYIEWVMVQIAAWEEMQKGGVEVN